jgi:hypothetical protein
MKENKISNISQEEGEQTEIYQINLDNEETEENNTETFDEKSNNNHEKKNKIKMNISNINEKLTKIQTNVKNFKLFKKKKIEKGKLLN